MSRTRSLSLVVTVLVHAFVFAARGDDFETILNASAETDLRVKKALLSLERQKMRMERQEASQGFNLALSSSGPKYTFDASKLLDAASSDPMHRLDMGVSASLGFGDPLGSSLVLSLSSATDFSALPSVSAGLGYTQPVSGLLGLRTRVSGCRVVSLEIPGFPAFFFS